MPTDPRKKSRCEQPFAGDRKRMQVQHARSTREAWAGVGPAYGALSSLLRDNVYWFGRQGLIFTSPWVATPTTVRHSAVLLVSATGEPFQVTVGRRLLRGEAFAIAPLVRRGLRAVDSGLVSVNVEAGHPCFAAFGGVPHPGVVRLERSAFAASDGLLVRAYEGRLDFHDARRLFEDLIRTTVDLIPGTRRGGDRAELLRGMLRENPACSLGDLARELDVSYTSASRVFAQAVGLPLRSYQQWLKCMQATEQLHADIALTLIAHESGFVDSAHLSRTWRRSYGLTPSYLRNADHVRLVLEPTTGAGPSAPSAATGRTTDGLRRDTHEWRPDRMRRGRLTR
jgi:AraC-like DNA-binding protein